MDSLNVAGANFGIRRALAPDVPAIVALLTDDFLGETRETTDLSAYETAFARIDADPSHYLAVIVDATGAVVGTMQLTLIPGVSRGGATRLQIEAVRLAPSTRGRGLGTAMFAWAHEYGRGQGAALVQLTTDKKRADAHRFYERLGYAPSHEGFKLEL
ncbi:GNAT family N-acetyltransferase [Yimella sp. cx-51]|uniref:GNAT family N-acetyltransferase n=1 Tax=Yimella sp. cx-51 TaxID=2770551 RepID=UPI00165E0E1C|nr:GNAT family N-acetyltransferase [Yimella sp. cx-51]MBC9955467.1 GNAT family N-acetyltransferase [Yimella sp. cx-51]QTH37946.1 GNAT family N-acetyltransferase [Yimella sp. cx-51]